MVASCQDDRGEPHQPADGGSGHPSPVVRGHSVEMTESQPQAASVPANSNSRENVCLCPASPKIPRPRNCEESTTATKAWQALIVLQQHLFYSVNINNPVSLPRIQAFQIRKYQRLSGNNGVVCPLRPKRNGTCL